MISKLSQMCLPPRRALPPGKRRLVVLIVIEVMVLAVIAAGYTPQIAVLVAAAALALQPLGCQRAATERSAR